MHYVHTFEVILILLTQLMLTEQIVTVLAVGANEMHYLLLLSKISSSSDMNTKIYDGRVLYS